MAAEQRHPIFSGTLPPDVSFFGFDLTVANVKGGASEPGWYFVLQEQPSEPRFGLDAADGPAGPIESWDEFSWGHLGENVAYVELGASPPTAASFSNPTGAVWDAETSRASDVAAITLQPPVRVAIHGSDLLP